MNICVSRQLFRINGVSGVFFGGDFITVTKVRFLDRTFEIVVHVNQIICGFYTLFQKDVHSFV